MRSRWWLALLALVLAVVVVIVVIRSLRQRPAAPTRLPDVVLVTVDALRRDHVGAYDAAMHLTPALDALAEEALVFEDTVTPAPLTASGLASILTGRLPIQHRLRTDTQGQLHKAEVTLEAYLRGAGYRTGAFFASTIPVHAGLARGYETLSAPAGAERPSQETVQAALEWIREREDTPLFVWIHLCDPRGPWLPPHPWGLRHLDEPYAGEVAAVDEAVGSLVNGLRDAGRYAGSHLIVTAPVGASLGEEGEVEHGALLGEATLRVPWIWHRPEGDRAEAVRGRITGLTSTTDLLPTLLDQLGIAPPETCEGHILTDGSPSAREALVVETFLPRADLGWAPLLGLRTHTEKLVAAPRERVYKFAASLVREMTPSPATDERASVLRAQLVEELEALSPGEFAETPLDKLTTGHPDPYKQIKYFAAITRAARALQLGDADPARGPATLMTKKFPDHLRTRFVHAYIDYTDGRVTRAEEHLRTILDQISAACGARLLLAQCQLAKGDAEGALSTLTAFSPDSTRTCLRFIPPDPDAPYRYHLTRGLSAARTGNFEGAAQSLRRAAETASRPGLVAHAAQLGQAARFLRDVQRRDGPLHTPERPLVVRSALRLGVPSHARALLALDAADDPLRLLLDATTAAAAGRLGRAEQLLGDAVLRGAAQAADCIALARVCEEHGDRAQAIRILEGVLPTFTKSGEIHFHLARMRAYEPRKETATIHLETALRLGYHDWDQLLRYPVRLLCKSQRVTPYWSAGGPS